MTITKTFRTIRAAARYQMDLYNRYGQVQLIKAPIFGEDGVYTWQVVTKKKG